MTHVLVIEDDAAIRTSLVRALGDRGHTVSSAHRGLDGLQHAVDDRPELVLLDLGLPDLDGHTVLSMLRAVRDTPVIVVTARDDDASVVRALDSGADDYVFKPFTVDQLEARMRAVLRRTSAPHGEDRFVVGGLVVHPTSREVTLDGVPVELSRREFDLLLLLASRVGEVVTKREILAQVWQQVYGGGERTVDVHLSWLRRKLGESAAHPRYLHSVRGVGVRLSAPEAPDAPDAPEAPRVPGAAGATDPTDPTDA
ncbi:response regulator transcription factor [Intrasporangium flavum]|uniref:response regulator transcription factor n=1 Tax=Intrasporangium flavum TaxID=1428657 RepID=UPI00096E858B|nr:response regulator transcription factor [Intrasporangium flavum]